MKALLRLLGFGPKVKAEPHPITVFDVEPAEVPSPALERQANSGRLMLEHSALKAERTVAALHQIYAAKAAAELQGPF